MKSINSNLVSDCVVRDLPPALPEDDDERFAERHFQKHSLNEQFAQGLFNATHRVYFRAGLIACREYMARFVEAESPTIAASIRANWWPDLGPDLGGPRQMKFDELTLGGEEGPWEARTDISPTLEALAIAWLFLETPPTTPKENT